MPTRPRGSARRSLILAVALAATACAGSSRSTDDYRHKAANSAEAMLSAVGTARIAGDLYLRGRAFGSYVAITVRDAEDDGTSIQSTFDSVQPPTSAADDIRDRLDQALQQAVSGLADLRIAVRRGADGEIRSALDTLGKAQHALEPLEKLA